MTAAREMWAHNIRSLGKVACGPETGTLLLRSRVTSGLAAAVGRDVVTELPPEDVAFLLHCLAAEEPWRTAMATALDKAGTRGNLNIVPEIRAALVAQPEQVPA